MILNPKLRPNLKIVVVPQEGICLFDEGGVRVLTDYRYQFVFPLINGIRSVTDIADELADALLPAEVYYTLLHLEDEGYIVDRDQFNEKSLVEEVALLNNNSYLLSNSLDRLYVLVDNLTNQPEIGTRFAESLRESGLQSGTSYNADVDVDVDVKQLRIALVEDYLSDSLIDYSKARQKDGVNWILVKPIGLTAWVGPLIQSNGAVCWECLSNRLKTNRLVETHLRRILPNYSSPTGRSYTSAVNVAAAMTTSLVANWYVQDKNLEENTLLQFSFQELTITKHPVIPLDNCAKCHPSASKINFKIKLTSRRKVYTADGGYRSKHPSETLLHESRLVSPDTGIISRLFRLEGSTAELPVFLARHNFGYLPKSLASSADNLANTSAGKGRTVEQARASALCEAVERHAVFFQEGDTKVPGTFLSLGDEAIHPNDCMLYSDTQYEYRDEWNSRAPWSLRVPEPLPINEKIEWSPVWSLTEKRMKFLPTSYLYHTHHILSPQDGGKYCFADSNGNAAGNNLEEAVLQGFLELVERDAVAVWWYNKLSRPLVKLLDLDDPFIFTLLRQFNELGRRVWVVDITHDLGIPVFVALSSLSDEAREGGTDEILTGFGSHLDPKIALSRSLTELCQMLPRAQQKSRHRLDSETSEWFENVTLQNTTFLSGDASKQTNISSPVGPQTDDLLDDIHFCQSVVENIGLEMLILDQTRYETGLASVKVVIPGMRHYWRRLAPGRLYDVPVNLGWLQTSITEPDLNQFSMLG